MSAQVLRYGGNIATVQVEPVPADGRAARREIAAALALDGRVITGSIHKPIRPGRYMVAFSEARS